MSESSLSDSSSVSSKGVQEPTTRIGEAGDADAVSGLDQRSRLVVLDTFEELGDNTGPPIVLVHVAVLCPREKFHSIPSLLPESKARRAELLFRVELDDLLVGDLIEAVVEQQAIYLLQDLISHTNQQISEPADESKRKSNTVFALVAYDFGAAIVNMAMWFAAKHPDVFPHIFSRTFSVVFSGCPQRSPGGETGMQRVLSDLLRERTAERQDRQITPLTLHSLAHLMISTAGLFVASKYTLRSRVLSVHAHESALGHIHPSITAFVGSVGTATDILIQEKPEGDERYPSLSSTMTANYDATPSPEWEDLDDMLLCLAPPHTQHHFETPFSPASPDRIRNNAAFVEWRDHCGVQVLYIAEASSGPALEVACRLISAGRGNPFKEGEPALCFNVCFDTYYNNIPSMIASILAQSFAYREGKRGDVISKAIRNQHVFRTGWNRKSALSLLDYYRDLLGHSSVLLLQSFDQCRKEDRWILRDYLSELSGRSEWPLKVIVTSTEPNALREEIGSWSVLNADGVVERPTEEQIYEPNNLLRHFPVDTMRANFRTELDRLNEVGTKLTGKMLRVLGECSRWPADTSAASIAEFCRLLQIVSTTRNMDEALHGIIMSRTNVRGFNRALSLLVCSHRQLSFRELIFFSLYQEIPKPREASDYHLGLISIGEKALSNALEQSLHGLVDYHGSHVVLRPEIQRLLSSVDSASIWNKWKQSSHSNFFELYISLLMFERNQNSLDSMTEALGSVLESSESASPSLLLRREMIQYAVQALPHHLRECPQSIIDRIVAPESESLSNAMLAWAQAYWAGSSQLLRMPEKPESHLTILSMFGIGTYEDLSGDISSFVSAVLGSSMAIVETWLENGDLGLQDLTDALVTAIQAGNETLALTISEALVSRHRDQIVWPVTVLRGAVWSNMPRLVEILLKNGVNPNSREDYASIETDIGYSVMSPLFIACGLGLVKVFHDLLNAGAKASETDVGQSNYLSRAAWHGNPDIVDAIIKRSLLSQWNQNYIDDLVMAAASGNWRTCQLLLNESEDSSTNPDKHAASKQDALIHACRYGHVKTARVFLDHGLDPNVTAADGKTTPLWLASLFQPDIQMVQDLLLHGADSNVRVSGNTLLSTLPRDYEGEDDKLLILCDALLSNHTPVEINAPSVNSWTALMTASSHGRLAMVNWLIDNGAKLDAVNELGNSALGIAVVNGYLDVMRRLLQENSDLNHVNNNGIPLICRAASHPEIVTLLLDAGADAEAADRDGWRLIHYAIDRGREDVLKMLVDRKVDLNTPNARGLPPISYAVRRGSIDMFRLLAARGATLSGLTGDASLLHAAIRNSSDMLRAVLEFRKFLDLEVRDSFNQTPLMAACSDIECWTLIINAGADLNAMQWNKWTPLHFAVDPGMANFRSILLSQPDIDIERGGDVGPPLYEACHMLNIEAVRDLLASGASAHPKPSTDLYHATAIVSTIHGNCPEVKGDWAETKIELIRLLVSHGCDVRERIPGSLICGALSHACLAATPELVTLLLDEGARADECSSFGRRYPLHYAAANGIGIFKLIYDAYDGDMMVEDVGGRHCLHWAAQSGNAQTIRFILRRLESQNCGISTYVNTLDTDGWSPLCWAIRPFQDYRHINKEKAEASDFEGTVRILLENGADPMIKCRLAVGNQIQDISVLELARRRRAGIAIVNMLNSKIRSGDKSHGEHTEAEVPSGFTSSFVCDICFAPEIEPLYSCNDCYNWDACSKCYGSVQLFHSAQTQNDEKRHSFELSQGSLERLRDQGPQENATTQGATSGQEMLDGSDDDESLDLSGEDDTLDVFDDSET